MAEEEKKEIAQAVVREQERVRGLRNERFKNYLIIAATVLFWGFVGYTVLTGGGSNEPETPCFVNERDC